MMAVRGVIDGLKLESIDIRLRRIWFIVCLLAGIFFVYVIPITVSPGRQVIKITATGDRNAAAKGSEVWIKEITTELRTPPRDITSICKGDWVEIDGLLVSSQHQPSTLECSLSTDEDQIQASFGMHPWAGKMLLTFENQAYRYDLYSASGDIQEVRIPIVRSWKTKAAMAALFLLYGSLIGLGLFASSVWLLTRSSASSRDAPRKSVRWFVFGIPPLLVWSVYLLAFWPGFLSPDSVYQFEQIAQRNINDWHPAIHTLVMAVITFPWFSPAPVVIVQILILSGLIGWGLSQVQKSGVSIWLTGAVSLFLAFSPGLSLIILNPWKDVAFGIALFAFSIVIFQIIQSDGRWLAEAPSWMILGVVSLLAALFRHNGLLVSSGSLVLILIAYPKRWRRIGAAILFMLILFFLVKGPLYQLAGVNTDKEALGKNLGIEGTAFQVVHQHLQSNALLLPAEEALFRKIYTDQEINLKELGKLSEEINQLALQLTLRNPVPTIEFLQRKVSFVFQILQPPDRRIETVGLAIYENTLGIEQGSMLPWLQQKMTELFNLSGQPGLDWLFWRNAFWMYLMIFAAAIACIRQKNWSYALLLGPLLLNALPLAAFSGGEISRYIYPTLLISPVFSGYLLFIPRKEDMSV